MKVAYLFDNFYPQVNGVVTSSINTFNEMKRQGHEVIAFAPRPKRADMKKYPSDYFPENLYWINAIPAYFYPDFYFSNPFSHKVYKIIRDFKPDLIHFQGPMSFGYMAIRIARKLGVPVIGTFHTFFDEPEYFRVIGCEKVKLFQIWGWAYTNAFFDRCDAVVSPGIQTASILKEKNSHGNITIVSNAVEVKKYQNFTFTGQTFFNEDPNKDYIIYTGRVSEEKCLEVLLDAMSLVVKQRPNTVLVVVGGGPSRQKLIKKASKMGIADNVIFTGMIPNKNLLESGLLSRMKLFVTPSTSENQPMTIIEAIAFGLPIVGVNAKGVPELIEDNGIIVEPNKPPLLADAILKILTDPALHKQYSERSIALSENYDIANTTKKMLELYNKTIEEYNK